ncbi:16S rRNA (cytidine(1402)-2'-O)-methyltransferase [Patescibacteria group bacterium]|nr:16S rRNA (cytidine(1402)-2'-O)-methyltransferase [Patescibacteria group bacterium]MBU1028815.1 16S rRNA (cytidine(1402)-2'-O)-methyltransferase [Patescibacteria group bacterium]MBU1915783.1 16S rRNA (cytidine(1402)-2'-O)-methyltransferase [Patescibacteria group bacterium]
MAHTLFIIATPIGNLNDLSSRALATLRAVDLLLCEDTRVTRKLLNRFEIKVPTESYREQNHEIKVSRVVELLRQGSDVGLVSDAGTPGISDPGSRLVRDILQEEPLVKIVTIPGPSAVIAAVSIAGFPAEAFTFLGFPPHKKGRSSFLQDALNYPHPVVLYESPHRILKTLSTLAEQNETRQLCVLRELTKLHETVYRGTAQEIKTALNNNPRGEFVIVIDRQPKK